MRILRKAWGRLPEKFRRALGLRAARQSVASARAVARHNARLGVAAPVLNFYPERPLARAQLLGVLGLLGVRIGSDVRSGPQIAWHKGTWLSPDAQQMLADYAINRACTDISKSRVDAHWAGVAGYSASVDPLLTFGRLVVKSEENARHDWRIVDGPLRRRQQGKVYQRYIDASAGDLFIESRPVIMRGHIALVYAVHSPRKHWRTEARLFPIPVGEAYSVVETGQLLEFAAAIGLEYGELDVVRDNATGRLYVLDANPTPVRPHHIAPEHEAAGLRQMADAFAAHFAADLAR